jgi:DNA-binding beta-propeller fold protein YncE
MIKQITNFSLTRFLVYTFALSMLFSTTATLHGREIAKEIVFGHYGKGIGEFLYPVSVKMNPQNNIVVVDFDTNSVSIYTTEGVYLGRINPDTSEFSGPIDVAYDNEGSLYVVEMGTHQIRKFDPAGKQVLIFGGPGTKNGRFRSPRAVVCDDAGNVFVADYRNRRVQQFSSQGEYIRSITWFDPKFAKDGQPRSLRFDKKGFLWVVYTANNRIVRFDKDFNPSFEFGKKGSNPSQFDQPRYIAFDARNAAYVTDRKNNRIQKFADDGRFLYIYGAHGRSSGQLYSPEGIDIDDDGNIVIADAGNMRIQIFQVKKEIQYSLKAYDAFLHKNWDTAIFYYQKLLVHDPASTEAINNLTTAWGALAEQEIGKANLFKAHRYYQKIIKIQPSNKEVTRKIRDILWVQNKGKVYYVVLGFGIIITMIFLLITLVRIIRSD